MMVSLSSSRISMLNSLFLISFFNILPYVTPLDEKSAFEKECFVPNVENVEVDYDWVKRNIVYRHQPSCVNIWPSLIEGS
jgi:hypothetical protein